MGYKTKGLLIFLITLTLSILFSITDVHADDKLKIGVSPAIIKADVSKLDSYSFSLMLYNTGDIDNVKLDFNSKVNLGLLDDYQVPNIVFNESSVILKQGKSFELKVNIAIPEERLVGEYDIDILISTSTDGVTGSLKVPCLLWSSGDIVNDVRLKETKVASSVNEQAPTSDYKGLLKSLFTFNIKDLKEYWMAIRYKTYIKNSKNGIKVDLGETALTEFANLLVNSPSDFTSLKYIAVAKEPPLDSQISHIKIESKEVIITDQNNEKYTFKFNILDTSFFKQQVTELSEKFKGVLTYKDISTYVKLPSTIYSDGLNLVSLFENKGNISEQPKITYTYYKDGYEDEKVTASNSVLLLKGSEREVKTPLDMNFVENRGKLIIEANAENITENIHEKIVITFCSLRYKPLYIILGVLLMLILIEEVIRRKFRKNKKSKVAVKVG